MNFTKLGGAVLLSCALSTAALAHHQFASEFDWKKPVTLNGTLTKIDWSTPHVVLQISAKDGAGAPVEWTVELGNPGLLEKKYGWTKTTLKVNDMVTVDGWQAHENKKLVSAMTVTTAQGRALFAGSSFFDMANEPQPPKQEAAR
jgi:Family of unknown function (DUF6152)